MAQCLSIAAKRSLSSHANQWLRISLTCVWNEMICAVAHPQLGIHSTLDGTGTVAVVPVYLQGVFVAVPTTAKLYTNGSRVRIIFNVSDCNLAAGGRQTGISRAEFNLCNFMGYANKSYL